MAADAGTSAVWNDRGFALKQRGAELMLRRTLRVVWIAGLVPFGAVAVSLLMQQPEPVMLQEAAMTQFRAPLGAAEMVTDRVGTHVAIVTGEADVEVLEYAAGALSSQTIDVPWTQTKAGGTALQWVDVNRDELADLRVTPLIDEALMTQLAEGRETEYAVPCFDFVQTRQGFRRQDQPADRLESQDEQRAGNAYVDGQTFELSVEEGWRQRTQLVGNRGGRQVLSGGAMQVADLNGDGRDEILTCEESDEEYPVRVTYRVYAYLDNRFQAIWQFESVMPDDDLAFLGGALRAVLFADLDGDGSAEVVCSEATTGEVRVLRWQDPALGS